MHEFLREILRNRDVQPDTLVEDHIEGDYTVKNVPCRNVEGIGIVYSAKTMGKVLELLSYMRKNNLKELEFDFTI